MTIIERSAQIYDLQTDTTTETKDVVEYTNAVKGTGMTPDEIGDSHYVLQPANLSPVVYDSHIESFSSYSDYISYIDAAIASTSHVKNNLGTCSNSVDSVYSYTISGGSKNLLIVAGQHSEETLGMICAFKFFENIAKSSNIVANYIKKHYTVTIIPVANPSGWLNNAHSGRLNANGVNINRNYSPAYWDRYDDTEGTGNAKGASALSEIESQYVKSVIDDIVPDVVIDCHNLPAGYGASDIYYNTVSSWHGAAGQGSIRNTVSNWTIKYSGTVERLSPSYTAKPTLTDFAAPYIDRVLLRNGASSLTIEACADLEGSSPFFNITAQAITKYCGFIAEAIMSKLSYNSTSESTPHFGWYAVKTNTNGALSLSDGGSLINSVTPSSILWDQRSPNISATQYDYLECVTPIDGEFFVDFSAYMANQGASPVRIDFKIYQDDVAVGTSVVSTTLEASSERAVVSTQARIFSSYDGESTKKISVKAYKINAANPDVVLYYPKLTVSFKPFNEMIQTPRPI